MVTSKESRQATIRVDDVSSAIEYCYEAGWTDGLPVVPPTVDLVDAMLDAAEMDQVTVIGEHVNNGLLYTNDAADAANSVDPDWRRNYKQKQDKQDSTIRSYEER